MSGIGRASVLIGAGTIVSRLTGFLRAVVLVSAVGATTEAPATRSRSRTSCPNNIYAIISTGLLSAVVVPQIVKAAAHDDGGRAFVSKLFTLGTVVLLGTTRRWRSPSPRGSSSSTPPATRPISRRSPPRSRTGACRRSSSTGSTRWSASRSTRGGSTGPTPGRRSSTTSSRSPASSSSSRCSADRVRASDEWTPQMIAAARRHRDRRDRRAGGASCCSSGAGPGCTCVRTSAGAESASSQIGRLAGWTFLMVVAGQLAGLVQSRVLSRRRRPSRPSSSCAERLAAVHAPVLDHRAVDRDAVLHAAERARRGRPRRRRARRHRAQHPHPRSVRRDRDGGARGRGRARHPASSPTPPTRLVAAAPVLLCFLVEPHPARGAVRRAAHLLRLRRHPHAVLLHRSCSACSSSARPSSRAPSLPLSQLAAGVALGQSIASVVQVIVATWLLHRRLGGLRIGSWMLSLGRFVLAAVPAAGAGWLTFLAPRRRPTGGRSPDKLLGALGAADHRHR